MRKRLAIEELLTLRADCAGTPAMSGHIVEQMTVDPYGQGIRNPLAPNVRVGECGGKVGDVFLVGGGNPFAEPAQFDRFPGLDFL